MGRKIITMVMILGMIIILFSAIPSSSATPTATITANPTTISPGGSSDITLIFTDDQTSAPIPNLEITGLNGSFMGSFNPSGGYTNGNGRFTTTYHAPNSAYFGTGGNQSGERLWLTVSWYSNYTNSSGEWGGQDFYDVLIIELDAAKVPTGAIEISWEESNAANFNSYELYVSEDANFSPNPANQVTTITNRATTSYRVEGLEPGTVYYSIVRVIYNDGTFDDSDRLAITAVDISNSNLMLILTLVVVIALVAVVGIVIMAKKAKAGTTINYKNTTNIDDHSVKTEYNIDNRSTHTEVKNSQIYKSTIGGDATNNQRPPPPPPND